MKPESILRLSLATVLLAAALLGAAHPALAADAKAAEASKLEDADYQVGAGDLLQIVVWKNPDLSGEYRVRPDGKFSMPLIGDVIAEGKSVTSIGGQVEIKLKQFVESPYVSVIVREATSNKIYVLGEVARPGTYPIEGSLTILQALALAGGFTEFAKRDVLVLVRGVGTSEEKININYRDILRSADKTLNQTLRRGDTLVVP